jgi:tetratricopeptide (TPR) repeat protein
MTENRNSKPKVKTSPDSPRGATGRRPGRNTTHQVQAYKDELPEIRPQDLIDPESSGASAMVEGFYQPTAMLDKGELLGELAEIAGLVPDTRAAVEAEAPPKGCRLIVVSGPDIGVEWAYKQPEVVMGRDEECELVLSDIGVSRRHAKISLEKNRFFLTDLGSGNGTYLNGVRIEREPLQSGDEIVIGERTLRFVELTDAPSTDAAHPVGEKLTAEPQLGSASKVSVAKEKGLGKASQVDVGAVPQGDGPKSAPDIKASLDQAKEAPGPRQGAALKSVVVFAIVMGVLLALGVGGWIGYEKWKDGKAHDNAEQVAKRQFLQGVELVKALRFGDAMILFDRVLLLHPDHGRAKEYKDHCEKELKIWEQIESARQLASAKRYSEAVGLLEGFKEDTAYAPEIERMKKEYARAIAEAMVREARAKLAAGDYDAAMEIADGALAQSPALASAQGLRQEIDAAKDEANKPKPKPKPETPPEMMRAVALYRNDAIGAAIDAAEASGGPNAQAYVGRMKRIKQLLAEASEAHRKKAAGDLLRIAPAALELDQQVSLGEGKVRSKLKGYYADGLYLKAIEAYQEKDFVKAYQLLTEALKQKPDHKLSETKLADLSRKAHDLYYEGFVLKDSNAAETKKIFRRVVQMTSPDNQFHRSAQKWLAANGG